MEFLIPEIINFMNSIMDIVFNLADNPEIKQAGNDVIMRMVERTENEIAMELQK